MPFPRKWIWILHHGSVWSALGDFVAVIDPLADDIGFLPEMLDKATCGADVVFVLNEQ